MKTSSEVATTYTVTAEKKVGMSIPKMLLSAVFAGIFIGLGGLGSQVASTAIGGTAGKLAGACVFPVGLFLVVTVGAELFTGNCLLAIPWLSRTYKKEINKVTTKALLKNWCIVYLGNFIGGLLLALAVYAGGIGKLLDGALTDTFVSTAITKLSYGAMEATIRAILCNFLVCLAVWVAMQADTVGAKAIAVFAPVMLFVLCGFEHSIANMYFIPVGMLYQHGMSIRGFLLNNLLPVTIGNILGGAVCIGGGLWAIYKS